MFIYLWLDLCIVPLIYILIYTTISTRVTCASVILMYTFVRRICLSFIPVQLCQNKCMSFWAESSPLNISLPCLRIKYIPILVMKKFKAVKVKKQISGRLKSYVMLLWTAEYHIEWFCSKLSLFQQKVAYIWFFQAKPPALYENETHYRSINWSESCLEMWTFLRIRN